MKESLLKSRLASAVRERTIGYITAGLGLVAGLAWNDAIRSLLEHLFPIDRNGIVAKFIYAIMATLAVVVVSIIFIRSIKNTDNESRDATRSGG
jgi:hypothetical protein